MTEWIITSCVLILVVIILRTVLKGKISLRLQYALWALVLVRLLIPGSLFSSSVSVMNAVGEAPPVSAEITIADPPGRWEYPGDQLAPAVGDPNLPEEEREKQLEQIQREYEEQKEAAWQAYREKYTRYITLSVADILRIVWYVGMAVMALWLIICNLRFRLRLTRSRELLKYGPPALYVAAGIETPCLFGLFQPAIYVSPEVAENRTALAHVLAHEETHYHHRDHIWALLRCICLVVHWYNPLVWLAAALSRRDSELACDEGAIRRLGEEQRTAYGRTLIGLTCTGVGGLLRTATTMTGSKKSIKERIVLIAKKPKMKLYTLVSVILIAAIAAGCTFTGRETEQQRVVSWMSSLELKDLEQARWVYTGTGEMEVPLLENEQAERLYAILQQVREGDLLEDNELDSGENRLALPVGEDDSLFFDCLSDGTLRLYCENRELQDKHGFSAAWRLNCPDLYDFIMKRAGQGLPEDPMYLEQAAKHYVQDVMEAHAAELTAKLGYDVSVGGVMEYKALSVGEAARDLSIEGAEVRYFLTHHFPEREDGKPVYGGVVAYSRFLYFLRQGDSAILLGHTDQESLANVYGTPEMIDKYGDTYTAAAMGMYHRYQLDRAYNMAILSTPNAVEAAFYDLNGDGVSEIIIKAGTCEADFEYVIYTYRNGAQGDMEPIGREQGGHSYLAISDDGALIIASGHMMVENAWRITWENGVFRSEWIIANRDAQNDGYTNWPKRLQTLVVNQGVIEEPRPGEPIGKSGVGLTVEAETAKAAAEEFFMAYGRAELLSNGDVADYNVQYNETLEISHDEKAVVGRFVYRVLPYEQAELHPDSSWEAGKGDYEGWYCTYPWFLLEKQADGLWLCTQWRADGEDLKLSDFGYENGMWGAIYGNPRTYRCQETDPQKAAETLVSAYVADLTKMDNMRCFTITDYRNLEVSVTPTLEMSETDRSVHNYDLKDSEIGEDHWIVEFTMEYRWIGILHAPPAGPGNGDYWMDQVHQGSPVGLLLTRDGDEFVLQSRWGTRY